ncbi:MAG TPA: zinc ribbon domain-containing protein [Gemmatimonadaceae bacterium]|nr:zinc ribbon domain-containing protein [Gemmatimonadaceae bacterium]
MPAPATTTCPSCGAAAEGRFCANCGTPLEGATCRTCASPLTSGARFCHHCGASVGAARAQPAPDRATNAIPWVVASIALVSLIALVAAQRFSTGGAAQAFPQTPLSELAPDRPMNRAPDISQLTPRERADRLFDRIMGLHERGRTDSVQFFAQMAIPAYQMVQPLDLDARYDMGRIAEVAGLADFARAQADTILRAEPNHLLGLVLAIRAARLARDESAAVAFERRLVAVEPAERRRDRPEYTRHRADIDAALEIARVEAPR